tara:strand:- start:248 stop:508 length:261 start_codon:yes stop_codon:yes gene_type:complete
VNILNDVTSVDERRLLYRSLISISCDVTPGAGWQLHFFTSHVVHEVSKAVLSFRRGNLLIALFFHKGVRLFFDFGDDGIYLVMSGR